jgi:hypothetical protein
VSGYRSEEESLRRRVETLEEELAEAKETIARLEGPAVQPPDADGSNVWYLGRPRELVLEKSIDLAPTDETLVAVADHLRTHLTPYGQVSQVGRQLVYRNNMWDVTLTGETDSARLRLRALNAQLAGLLVVGFVVFPTTLLPFIGAFLGPVHLLWAMPIAALVGFLVARFFVGMLIDRQRTKLVRVFDEVTRIASKKPKAKRVRVVEDAKKVEEEPLGEDEAETKQKSSA